MKARIKKRKRAKKKRLGFLHLRELEVFAHGNVAQAYSMGAGVVGIAREEGCARSHFGVSGLTQANQEKILGGRSLAEGRKKLLTW